MSIRQSVIDLLEARPGEYISGSDIAERLHVTRAAVWKCVQGLQEEGFLIEAGKNRGYCLRPDNDTLTENGIRRWLDDPAVTFDIYGEVSSTNLVLKESARFLPEWRVAVADRQTEGRGRLGRSFYSPPGTGLYLSILLRPDWPVSDAGFLTTGAAVAVARAVEDCGGGSPRIKWVNDVVLRERKICGILTEASLSVETGGIDYAVLGVGINVYPPPGGFPEELAPIAGAVFPHRRGGLRCELAAAFLKRFREIYDSIPRRDFVEEYRRRSFLIGQPVNVLRPDCTRAATVLDVDPECRLLVRYEDGSEEALSSGEVSVRPTGGAP